MKKPIIWPYKIGSKGAKTLAKALNTKRVRSNGKYKPNINHVVINWGNRSVPDWITNCPYPSINVLNEPLLVTIAANKLGCLVALQEGQVSVPEFTVKKDDLKDKKGLWVARKLLNASCGKGIVLFDPSEDEIPDAPLYVKYVKKKDEYRVHVFRGKVIDVQQKKFKKGNAENTNFQIRNHANGWVFCREGVEAPPVVEAVALDAVSTIGLDFGAVDVIWNEKKQCAYVLEINTAPGLEGTTLQKYVEAIKEYCNEGI